MRHNSSPICSRGPDFIVVYRSSFAECPRRMRNFCVLIKNNYSLNELPKKATLAMSACSSEYDSTCRENTERLTRHRVEG